MRLRVAVAASLVAALMAVAMPAIAPAQVQHAPRHNDELTINAVPNPIIAGEGVLIYGRLQGPGAGGQTIRLFHHLAGGRRGYSLIGTTTTFANGYYEFVRATGVVYTNRDWFVAGPNGSHSRTIHEHVAALVTLNASTTSAVTGQRVVFRGHVTPGHPFQRVLLQQQTGSSDDWRTLRTALLGPGSGYAVAYSWRTAGERDIRVVLPGDARNIRSSSDAVQLTIQQKQVTGFTINTSNPIQSYGQSVKISGMLSPGPTAQPAFVQLWGRPASGGAFQFVGQTPVAANGAYSFTVTPTVNTVYQARAPFGAHRASAALWQGVRDVLTLTPSSATSTVGGTVTFNGTVIPDKTNHVVYLQRLGPDGDWHSVEARFVGFGSTYHFGWTFGKAGTFKFRARIYSDGRNVGSASAPVTITVSGLAPVTTLPSASAG
jgi:hypothetical protein